MTSSNRPPRGVHEGAGAAAALLLSLALAGCGSAPPSRSPTSSPTLPPTPMDSPTSTPEPAITASPTASIVTVPTSRFVAEGGAAATLDPGVDQALQAVLAATRINHGYPGISAAVMTADGTMWTGTVGSAVLSAKSAVTPATLFSVGSISKTFVAALIGRLLQAGKLRLDDPLSKYVPTFPDAAHITIRELLDHTSGIRDLFDIVNGELLADPTKSWTPAEVLAAVGARAYFKPGASYRYSNTDYVLLGEVAEKITGQKVAALVRADFLVPLGMTHTFLQTEEKVSGPRAHGYMGSAKRPRANFAGTMLPFTAEATAASFAGAYVSTASDLAIWANALYGGYVLDQSTLASMVDISPTARFADKAQIFGSGYGFGFEESAVDGTTAWGHRGHLDGFWAAMEYLPDYHVTIVVLTNAEWANPMTTVADLAKVVIG